MTTSRPWPPTPSNGRSVVSNTQTSLPSRRLFLAALCAAIGATSAPRVRGAAAGVSVSGTVNGSDVGPLAGASVVLEGPAHHEAKTGADGRFLLAGVAKGSYKARLSAEGYLPVETGMQVGDAAVSFEVTLLRLPGL